MSRFGGVVCQLSYERTEVNDGFDDIYDAIDQQQAEKAAMLLHLMETRLVRDLAEPPMEWLDELIKAYELLFFLKRRLSMGRSLRDAMPGRVTLSS